MSKELDNELAKKAFEKDVFYTDLNYESDLDDAHAYGGNEDVNAVHEKYNKAYAEIEEKYGMKIDDLREEHMKATEIESERLKKRNALCYIKKYTHRIMEERGFGQFIIACLPDDKRLWRANTNRKEMQKPNAIVREYVMQLLNQPNSGYKDALEDIKRYVRSRQSNESLSNKQARMLQKERQDRLINSCMNAVYTVLKNIPVQHERIVGDGKRPLPNVSGIDSDEDTLDYN
jgi:hypothetical protein